jgi:Na+-translocating ferredoxin:NAD+ oxidoreductase RNF subunit RnfB
MGVQQWSATAQQFGNPEMRKALPGRQKYMTKLAAALLETALPFQDTREDLENCNRLAMPFAKNSCSGGRFCRFETSYSAKGQERPALHNSIQ